MIFWDKSKGKEYIKANNETLFVRDGKVYSSRPYINGVCNSISELNNVIVKEKK